MPDKLTNSQVCGHCGTDVGKGYIVCKGCGAHYRRGSYILAFFFGVLGFDLGLLTLFANPSDTENPVLADMAKDPFLSYTISAGLIALSFLLIYKGWQGWQKGWYRFNP